MALRAQRAAHDRQRPVRYFFFGALLFFLYQSARMLAAFYLPLLAAAILALSVYPIHRRLIEAWPRPTGAALATAAATLFVIVLPLGALAWVLSREAPLIAPAARRFLAGLGAGRRESLDAWLQAASPWTAAWGVDPQQIFLANLEAWAAHLTEWAAAAVTHVVGLLLDVAALGVSLFFLLRDGPGWLHAVAELTPLPAEHKETLRRRVADTALGVFRGVLGVSVLQGALSALGFAFFGVPFPALLGALTAFASPVPIVGVWLILAPVTGCLALAGSPGQAWEIGLWSLVVVCGAEQIVRPWLINTGAKLPFWLLLFGVLGGIRLYGFAGLLIGPVLVTLALSFAAIYRSDYLTD